MKERKERERERNENKEKTRENGKNLFNLYGKVFGLIGFPPIFFFFFSPSLVLVVPHSA